MDEFERIRARLAAPAVAGEAPDPDLAWLVAEVERLRGELVRREEGILELVADVVQARRQWREAEAALVQPRPATQTDHESQDGR